MAILFSQTPRLYLESRGIRETLRTPSPRLRTDNPIHRTPLSFPNPLATLSLNEAGDPPPDRRNTLVWPHGGPPKQ